MVAGIMENLPAIAKLRSLEGGYDKKTSLDISPEILEGLYLIDKAREHKRSIETELDQGDMFTGYIDELTKRMYIAFNEMSYSNWVDNFLKNYYELALSESDIEQVKLEGFEKKTKSELLTNIMDWWDTLKRSEYGTASISQATLFDTGDSSTKPKPATKSGFVALSDKDYDALSPKDKRDYHVKAQRFIYEDMLGFSPQETQTHIKIVDRRADAIVGLFYVKDNQGNYVSLSDGKPYTYDEVYNKAIGAITWLDGKLSGDTKADIRALAEMMGGIT